MERRGERAPGLYGEAIRSTRESMERMDKAGPERHAAAKKQRDKDAKSRSDRVNSVVESIITASKKDKRRSEREEPMVLRPVKLVPPVIVKPPSATIYTIVPFKTEYPTASFVSKQLGTGLGVPWTTNPKPLAFPVLAAALGFIALVYRNRTLITVAIDAVQTLGQAGIKTGLLDESYRLKIHTGKGLGKEQQPVMPVPDSNSEWSDYDGWGSD